MTSCSCKPKHKGFLEESADLKEWYVKRKWDEQIGTLLKILFGYGVYLMFGVLYSSFRIWFDVENMRGDIIMTEAGAVVVVAMLSIVLYFVGAVLITMITCILETYIL